MKRSSDWSLILVLDVIVQLVLDIIILIPFL
jgi:hypothetical protein